MLSRIINRLSEEGGVLYFKYTIDVNSAFISENEVLAGISAKNGETQEVLDIYNVFLI